MTASATGEQPVAAGDINASDPITVTVTYRFTAPGGAWDLADNGSYTVNLAANQVKTVTNVPIPAAQIGAFTVLVPTLFTVTNLNDAGAGSLRQAILDANALTGPDQIDFAPSLFAAGPATISLVTALPLVTDSVTLT